jgi:glutaredoxin 3
MITKSVKAAKDIAAQEPMPKIEIYTSLLCPYCVRAKRLLRGKGVSFEEFDVTMKPKARAAMRERAGGAHTVPQIFIDGQHIGGCDELYALDSAGGLDPLLGRA